MIKKILLQLLCLTMFIAPSVLRAEEGEPGKPGLITGTVLSSDGEPVAAVSVLLKGTRKMTITDEKGNFVLRNIKPGTYELVLSFLGQESLTQVVTVEEDKSSTLTLKLPSNSVSLKEFTVKDRRSAYKENLPSNTLRLNEPLLEVPQNIQIVGSKVLQDQQVTSMSDGVIRNISGAMRLEHWGDLYTRIFMRGSRAAAFRNGMNITSTWGPLTEDMSFVDRIEIVKGPAGFMMSNGDPAGFYNVITKKPTGITKGDINMTLGSFDFYRGALDLDGKLSGDGKLLYRLNLMGQTKKSHRDYEFNNRFSIAPVISYQVDDKTKVTLEYTLQHVKMSDLGSYYVFGGKYGSTPRNFTMALPGLTPTVINDHSVMANVQHAFNSRWKLTAQLGYFNYKQEGSSSWPGFVDPANGNVIRAINIWDAATENTYGQLFLNGEEKTGQVNHRFLLGVDVGSKHYIADFSQYHQLDSMNAFFNIYKPNYGIPVNGLPKWDRSIPLSQRGAGNAQDQSYTGIYLQDELGFFNNALRVTLAGRYTYAKDVSYGTKAEASKFTPRVGVSWSVDQQTSVYALYDQSFVPQTGRLLNGGTVKPLTGNNMEIGIKRDWFGGSWNSTVSVYRIVKKRELTGAPNTDPNLNLSVEMDSQAQGVELDITGQLARGLSLVANYAYTDSKIKAFKEDKSKENKPVPGFGKHIANAWLNYRLEGGALKGLGVQLGGTFQGDRSTWDWGATSNDRLPDYFRLDGGLFWQKDRLNVTVNVFNLLNEYLYTGSPYGNYYYWQTEPGRNLRVSVGYRF